MFYYLSVAYYFHDLELDDTTDLQGPFESPETRELHIREQIRENWDLEEISVSVSLLEIQDGRIVCTGGGLAVDPELAGFEDCDAFLNTQVPTPIPLRRSEDDSCRND